MLVQIVTENGVKKIKPLTADTGTGAPVGSYLYLEKKSNPQGYLYCDGSTFDKTVYPALYQYLGTNVLPDWREFSAVGAEQNTTNVYDAQTNPNGVIHDHDVYTEGQAKDDQHQQHGHLGYWVESDGVSIPNQGSGYKFQNQTNTLFVGNATGRVGTVTRGKRKAVYIYIKATSGLTENQQENVLNTINENNSYSTEEHPTGKKWIDGKPIYQKVIDCGTMPNATNKAVPHNIQNFGYLINAKLLAKAPEGSRIVCDYGGEAITIYTENVNVVIASTLDFSRYSGYAVLEYTKAD